MASITDSMNLLQNFAPTTETTRTPVHIASDLRRARDGIRRIVARGGASKDDRFCP